MVLIATATFQSLSNEETDPEDSDARTDVTFYCIDGKHP